MEKEQASIQATLFDYFKDTAMFTLKEAAEAANRAREKAVKDSSLRARIYEGIDKGMFARVAKGVYTVTKGENSCLLVNGDGRDLSFLADCSVDAIITDHPYLDEASHRGGNRSFADYECFRYAEKDFKEKARVLKKGGFLCEFLPEENENNFEYLFEIKQMAVRAGMRYYAKVPWKKMGRISNTGRKAKQTEDVLILSKGKARDMRLDAKANYRKLREAGVDPVGMNSMDAKEKLEELGIEVSYQSGTRMLPASFDFERVRTDEQIHQAEKPVELIEEIIRFVSEPDEWILDQFSGSGSVGDAALKTGRNAILIEKDETVFGRMAGRFERQKGVVEIMACDDFREGSIFVLRNYGYLSKIDLERKVIRYSLDKDKAVLIDKNRFLEVKAFLLKNKIEFDAYMPEDTEELEI